jgi:hypothetical protein
MLIINTASLTLRSAEIFLPSNDLFLRERRRKQTNNILSELITAHTIPYTTAYINVLSILLGFLYL